MGFVVSILTVVYFITSLVLIIIVLMQEPKGGGLSSAFGGAGLDAAFGASIGRKMSSFTVWLAVFFLVLTIVLAILGKTDAGALPGSIMDGMDKGAAEEPEKQPPEKKQPDATEEKKETRPPAEGEKKESRPAGDDKAAPPAPEKKQDTGAETPAPPGSDG